MGASKSSIALSEDEIDHSPIPGLDDQSGPKFVTAPRPCPTWSFNEASSEWTEAEGKETSPTEMPLSISCVSYNIWFAQSFQKERASALAQLLESLQPSIICLVEVRQEPLALLMSLEWVRQNYYLCTTNLPIGGAIIMSHRKALPRPIFSHHTWPTNMPRILITARFSLNFNDYLTVGCVHLESMSSQPTREGQLRVCSQVLRSSPCALLMGDFNISEKKEENCAIERMLPSFIDVWPSLRKRDPGYTRDTGKNTMLHARETKKFRIDRIMCKRGNTSLHLTPLTVKILGDTKFATLPSDEGNRDVFISDHFGLLATFTWSNHAP